MKQDLWPIVSSMPSRYFATVDRSERAGLGLASIYCEGDFQPRQVVSYGARFVVSYNGRLDRGTFVNAIWRPDCVIKIHSFLDGRLEIASKSSMIDDRTFLVTLTVKNKMRDFDECILGIFTESNLDQKQTTYTDYNPKQQVCLLQDGITKRWLGLRITNAEVNWGFYEHFQDAEADFVHGSLNRLPRIEASQAFICQTFENLSKESDLDVKLIVVVGENEEEIQRRMNEYQETLPQDQRSETVEPKKSIEKENWNDFFNRNKIETSDPNLEKAHLYGLYITKANAVEGLAKTPPGITRPAILPSKMSYYGLWLWDTLFLGLPLVTTSDYSNVEGSVLTLLDNQHTNGLIPIATFPTRQEPHPKPLTQAPVLAMEGWAVYQAKNFFEGEESSEQFLRIVYPKLKKFHSFWYTERDKDGDGLCEYIHGWESGVDNSPYWDERGAENVEDLLLAIFLYLDSQYLGAMARVLGCESEGEAFRKEAQGIEDAILNEFYDRETELFYSRYFDNHELIQIKTFESLLPLLLDNIDEGQRSSIINHLTNSREFWTEYPVPTVSLDEPSFGSRFSGAWWRKPVWLSANWLLLKGLMKWGYYDEAKHIIDRTIQLVLKSSREEFGDRRFGENYDPVSGEMTKNQAHFFGWNGLVRSMILEFLGGISFYEPNGNLVFDPICATLLRTRVFDWFVSTEHDRYTFGFDGSRILSAERGVRCEVMARSDEKITIKLDSQQPGPFSIIAYSDSFKAHVQVRIEDTIVGEGKEVSWRQGNFPIHVDLISI